MQNLQPGRDKNQEIQVNTLYSKIDKYYYHKHAKTNAEKSDKKHAENCLYKVQQEKDVPNKFYEKKTKHQKKLKTLKINVEGTAFLKEFQNRNCTGAQEEGV